jgi:hypothetical protein
MKRVFLGALSVLALTATVSGAFAQGVYSAYRAAGPRARSVRTIVQQQSMRAEYAPDARSYAPGSPDGLYFDHHYGPNADRTGS